MADVFPTKLQLTVVTLDRKVLEVEADEVMLPAINGYIGVLPGHTPLLTILKVGEAMYRVGGRAHAQELIERVLLQFGANAVHGPQHGPIRGGCRG